MAFYADKIGHMTRNPICRGTDNLKAGIVMLNPVHGLRKKPKTMRDTKKRKVTILMIWIMAIISKMGSSIKFAGHY